MLLSGGAVHCLPLTGHLPFLPLLCLYEQARNKVQKSKLSSSCRGTLHTSRFPTTAANSMQFATNSVLHIAILRCLIQSLPLIQCLVTILLQPRIGKIQPASFYRGELPPSSRCCTVFSFLVASNRWGEIHSH